MAAAILALDLGTFNNVLGGYGPESRNAEILIGRSSAGERENELQPTRVVI